MQIYINIYKNQLIFILTAGRRENPQQRQNKNSWHKNTNGISVAQGT